MDVCFVVRDHNGQTLAYFAGARVGSIVTAMAELAAWDSFYVIVGSAAGALIGLQFVVVTLIAQRATIPAPEASAAFGTPTIVHFGAALLLSALVRAPWQTIAIPAILWAVVGLSGTIYALNVIRRMRAQGVYEPQFEDWLFHVVLPVAAYAILALSAFAALSHTRESLFGIGAAALLLKLAWQFVRRLKFGS